MLSPTLDTRNSEKRAPRPARETHAYAGDSIMLGKQEEQAKCEGGMMIHILRSLFALQKEFTVRLIPLTITHASWTGLRGPTQAGPARVFMLLVLRPSSPRLPQGPLFLGE